MDTDWVLCEVGTQFVYIIEMNIGLKMGKYLTKFMNKLLFSSQSYSGFRRHCCHEAFYVVRTQRKVCSFYRPSTSTTFTSHIAVY